MAFNTNEHNSLCQSVPVKTCGDFLAKIWFAEVLRDRIINLISWDFEDLYSAYKKNGRSIQWHYQEVEKFALL